jgi:TonB family protein
MRTRRSALLTCATLLAVCAQTVSTRGAAPPSVELRDASIAIGYDLSGRCPDLTQADTQDGAAALVVLVVGPSGVPSQPSIKSSSGSESLDAAAISCVMKLRFLPAVRAGEGSAMASWQEIAWKWSRVHLTLSPLGAGTASTTATATTATTVAGAGQASGSSRPGAGTPEVRVCVDESGQLAQDPLITRSSGDPGLDAAAVRIARSGAPYYRPAVATPVSGCVQLAVKFETK